MSGAESIAKGRRPFALEARGLRKSFGGVEVLHGVDFSARGGEILTLLGENGAGKSTAIKILAGDYRRDDGEILINGESVTIREPRDAAAQGIRVIYQEFSDAPDLSVAENLSLGNLPVNRFRLVDRAATIRRAKDALEGLGVDLDPHATVGDLGVAERQILEIARALLGDARLLILDEPTSALNIEETEALFAFIRRLRDRGVAIIYITHRLDEIEQISDRLIVFRDGYLVAEGAASDFTRHEIVEAMVGKALEDQVGQLRSSHGDESSAVLRMREASSSDLFIDVDLDVHRTEIVSLFGRIGCGAFELAESVFGLRPLDSGSMEIDGKVGPPASPREAIEGFSVGFVPVDRKVDGLLSVLTAADNISVASWPRLSRFGVLSRRASAKVYHRWREILDIRGKAGADQIVDTLSGGNQQKVILGRWLERESSLLVLAEPTRGVDVGARAEIYRVLREFADRGIGILVVTSDIEEVLRISDMIVVMSRGRVVARHNAGEVDRKRLTQEAGAEHTASAAQP